ncbi:hypothetical protein FRX31_004152 [Thalictrum thalictroides]|uniref:DUF4283 domain-containing protein n=1 Tax=Thalictrum thalictroides TaxID=46969 RepID=A0A7J6X957_THATH|nr:hypothetical protein FRX31_004152 [Thalictrum thalictroides]
MGFLDPRHVLVRFESETEVTKALSRYNCHFMGIRFKVFRWHTGFNLRKDPSFAPIWLDLPNLPLDFFHPALLKAIGDDIGTFLSIDKGTLCYTRPDVARLCVEMDIQNDMPDSIWIEGPNYTGFWQKILYPNFVYCSHCSKIGHAWEQCFKRKENHNKQKEKDALIDKQPREQQNTRKTTTWHQPRRRQQYVPRNTDAAGPSGTKDSQGCVIHDTTQTVSNRVEEDNSPVMDMDNEAEEQSRHGVPMQNAFAALNILDDVDEIIPHIPLRRTTATCLDNAASGPHNATRDQAHEAHREDTDDMADLRSNEVSTQLAIVVASERPQLANPNSVSSPILDPISSNPNLQDDIFIVPSSPLMLTNGNPEDEYEETVPETASYGSDTEVRGRKSFKTYAPALMMTRSRSQGHQAGSKNCFKCCEQ